MGNPLGLSHGGGINNLHWELRKGFKPENCPDAATHKIVERCASCNHSYNEEEEDYDGDAPGAASFI